MMRAVLHTTWGAIDLTLRDGHMVSCTLPQVEVKPSDACRCMEFHVASGSSADHEAAVRAGEAVRATIEGRPAAWPPFLFPAGSPFQQKVWRALRHLPFGQTCTYGELARRIGHPGAARAVGGACGANPLPLILPCHRVLASGGSLGGFSSGLPWKRWLLQQEGALP